jgi:hypothetical protein
MKRSISDELREHVRRHLEKIEKPQIDVIRSSEAIFVGAFMAGNNVKDALGDDRKLPEGALFIEACINAIGELTSHIVEQSNDDVHDEIFAEIKGQVSRGMKAGERRKTQTKQIRVECDSKEEAEKIERILNEILKKL